MIRRKSFLLGGVVSYTGILSGMVRALLPFGLLQIGSSRIPIFITLHSAAQAGNISTFRSCRMLIDCIAGGYFNTTIWCHHVQVDQFTKSFQKLYLCFPSKLQFTSNKLSIPTCCNGILAAMGRIGVALESGGQTKSQHLGGFAESKHLVWVGGK